MSEPGLWRQTKPIPVLLAAQLEHQGLRRVPDGAVDRMLAVDLDPNPWVSDQRRYMAALLRAALGEDS